AACRWLGRPYAACPRAERFGRSGVSESVFDDLSAFVGAETARRRIPGVALGVLHQGVEHTAAFGVTSAEQPLPVDADTLFQVGSITKTFTAMAAVRLVAQGD